MRRFTLIPRHIHLSPEQSATNGGEKERGWEKELEEERDEWEERAVRIQSREAILKFSNTGK